MPERTRWGVEVRLPDEDEWSFLAAGGDCLAYSRSEPLTGRWAKQAMNRLAHHRPDIQARLAQVPDNGEPVRISTFHLPRIRYFPMEAADARDGSSDADKSRR